MKVNNIQLGKEIGWGKGKNISFRKFITNNVDLPKTGVYKTPSKSKYWLDLTKRKNVKFILDLILDQYLGERRIMINEIFFNALKNLSNSMPSELSLMPKPLNKILVEELRG